LLHHPFDRPHPLGTTGVSETQTPSVGPWAFEFLVLRGKLA